MTITSIGMSQQIYHYIQVHKHDVWEITLNLEGSGYTHIGDQRFEYRPGTILCCPPNTPHAKFSDDGFRDIYITPSEFTLDKLAKNEGVLLFQDDTEHSFENLFFLALRTYHQQGLNYKPLVNSLWESMQQLLFSWTPYTAEEKDVVRLKNLITESFTNPEFSISNLLTDGPYCKDHLRRRFKKLTGMSPIEYLTFLRLEHAKKLMVQNHSLCYSISEIGAMSGYYDSHYFSRIFKKNTEMTPNEFMKEL